MKQIKYIIGISCFLWAGFLMAADVPTVVQGAQKYNSLNCNQEYAQNCISNTCLNSDRIDCQDNCRKLAADKCRQQANQ